MFVVCDGTASVPMVFQQVVHKIGYGIRLACFPRIQGSIPAQLVFLFLLPWIAILTRGCFPCSFAFQSGLDQLFRNLVFEARTLEPVNVDTDSLPIKLF